MIQIGRKKIFLLLNKWEGKYYRRGKRDTELVNPELSREIEIELDCWISKKLYRNNLVRSN